MYNRGIMMSGMVHGAKEMENETDSDAVDDGGGG